ncbi:beta-galactosidase, partial [Haloterrigena salina JCM 13891]
SRDGHTWVLNFRSDPVAVTGDEDVSWRLGGPEIDSFDLAIAETDAVDEFSVQIRE